MRCVLHGTRRKTGSVRETSRAVRTFGVRPVRIGFAHLAHQNLLLEGGTWPAAFSTGLVAKSAPCREARVLQ